MEEVPLTAKASCRGAFAPKNALYLFGTNKKVNQMNNKLLKAIQGEEKVIIATCLHKTIKHFDPSVSNAGTINNTPFQKELA